MRCVLPWFVFHSDKSSGMLAVWRRVVYMAQSSGEPGALSLALVRWQNHAQEYQSLPFRSLHRITWSLKCDCSHLSSCTICTSIVQNNRLTPWPCLQTFAPRVCLYREWMRDWRGRRIQCGWGGRPETWDEAFREEHPDRFTQVRSTVPPTKCGLCPNCTILESCGGAHLGLFTEPQHL